ncbi:class I SAM-dependent methyltransferase [Prosthecochloris sp. HL-130-GSB]|jgi:2-polyprenyl-3-methyl-5-hydroxy-6-metoxy-1,4-benzoquinol methylase|uniref:class I SAM-dependent methyltransferase n=1 Tax=Prosthecochloris sp. HL-130-GSB TaxID=1974213 RepID=UPI000A1C11EC|nr:class I SAM-dependent methyltransferase [Prosthecochloris sp. HL-130-GSB]ARM30350.1 methyltransferase type 12 [Prosthecochloris sp. HL-130-GSB]
MLQLRTAGLIAANRIREAHPLPAGWTTYEQLEREADRILDEFLTERFNVSKSLGPGYFLPELLDRSLRTEETEIMDRPDIPEQEKLSMINSLDRLNSMMMLYPHYLNVIMPRIEKVLCRRQQPLHVLELASGAGGLSFALAEEIQRKKLPVTITASDIVEVYVDHGNREAKKKQLPVTFRRIDAFSLDALEEEQFDIIIISQSLHHFTPGQIAVMIAKSRSHGAGMFLALDGHRSPELLIGVPLTAMFQGTTSFMLDGYTSARKFYSETELDLITEIATGQHHHTVDFIWPLSVLCAEFALQEPLAGPGPQHRKRIMPEHKKGGQS